MRHQVQADMDILPVYPLQCFKQPENVCYSLTIFKALVDRSCEFTNRLAAVQISLAFTIRPLTLAFGKLDSIHCNPVLPHRLYLKPFEDTTTKETLQLTMWRSHPTASMVCIIDSRIIFKLVQVIEFCDCVSQ